MTESEQRVAIAEWMGWQRIKDFSEGLMMPPGTSVCGYPPPSPSGFAIIGKPIELPDYTRDLNAIHEAEMRLYGSPEQYANDEVMHRRWISYVWFLNKQWGPCATAAQRAEALLRTLNLWKEP